MISHFWMDPCEFVRERLDSYHCTPNGLFLTILNNKALQALQLGLGDISIFYRYIYWYMSKQDITRDNIACIDIVYFMLKWQYVGCKFALFSPLFLHVFLHTTILLRLLTLWAQDLPLRSSPTLNFSMEMECAAQEELVSKQKINGSIIWF